jgi:hypothetical protein
MSSESIIIGNNNNFINIGNKSNISIINTNSTNTNSTNTNSTLITSSVTGQSNVYNKTSFGIYVSFASLCKIVMMNNVLLEDHIILVIHIIYHQMHMMKLMIQDYIVVIILFILLT